MLTDMRVGFVKLSTETHLQMTSVVPLLPSGATIPHFLAYRKPKNIVHGIGSTLTVR